MENPIEVINVTKNFRVYKDKSHTFKDKVLSHGRNRYALNKVLDNVSFSVKRGEALGLIGHNGCGKSTTLKLLNKILYPDSGEIKMRGRISSLIELGAGFHPDMTGRENIYINATIFGLHKEEIDQRLDDIIRFSELEDFIDNPVRTYSSGMYMRLAFAIAINVDADILLVDEILAVGDVNFQKKCFDRLQEIKEDGATIVIVSHSMDQIKSICDRVLWIDKGRIRESGNAAQVCEDYLTAMNDAAEKRKRVEKAETSGVVLEDPNVKYPPSEVSHSVGKNARRWGTMKARFQEVQLCNSKGKVCNTFNYKEGAIIQYSIVCVDPELKGYIQFNIIGPNGEWVSAIQSSSPQKKGTKFIEKKQGQVLLKELPYANGNYILEAALRDEEGNDIDVISHFIYFHMNTPLKDGTRVAALENTWN